eukprot:scaffold1166_cov261-Pinguiococcus_pyrenoidosus.AAC.52
MGLRAARGHQAHATPRDVPKAHVESREAAPRHEEDPVGILPVFVRTRGVDGLEHLLQEDRSCGVAGRHTCLDILVYRFCSLLKQAVVVHHLLPGVGMKLVQEEISNSRGDRDLPLLCDAGEHAALQKRPRVRLVQRPVQHGQQPDDDFSAVKPEPWMLVQRKLEDPFVVPLHSLEVLGQLRTPLVGQQGSRLSPVRHEQSQQRHSTNFLFCGALGRGDRRVVMI